MIALLVVAIPASATKTHLFKEIFGSAAQPSFTTARAVAVNQSTGDVLVMDAGGTPSIKRFNADGTPDNFTATGANVIDGQGTGDETPQNGLSFASASESQIAIDNSGGATDGNIYVTQGSPNLINIFSDEGEYLGQLTAAGVTSFSEACGVAVDSSGAVYVGDYSAGIHKFVPAANPPVNADNTATFATVTQPCALAAGVGATAGFLFAAKYEGPISKLDSGTGEAKYTVSPDANRTLTVDPGTGHVYAATGSAVKEFDASGAGSATSAASFTLQSAAQGMAVRGSTADVYVSRSENANVAVFGPIVALPEVATGSATAIEPTSATLNGSVNPDGVELSECKFEYGKTTVYGSSIPCTQSPATIGAGTSDVSVSANVSGLDLGSEYHFRLVAKNVNGTVNGADKTFKLQSPPVLKEEWVSSVTFREATLNAKINPEGFATTYHFEYGTTPSYGESTPEQNVGSDKADRTASGFLDGLQAGTTYHYRVVAINSIGTSEGADHTFTTFSPSTQDTSCPNQAFRTGASATLPDCRAYEMVSPVDKHGTDISTHPVDAVDDLGVLHQSSLDGEELTFTSVKAFGDAVSSPPGVQYMSSRGSAGWSTHAISPPRFGENVGESSQFLEGQFKAFSPDLSTGWLVHEKDPLAPGVPDGVANLYKREASGNYVPLAIGQPTIGDWIPELQGFSKDETHAVFAIDDAITPDAPDLAGRYQLYEWFNGTLRLVSILPNGEPAMVESSAGARNDRNLFANGSMTLDNAVSDDGSRIFWTAASSLRGGNIYVRIDGQATVAVSESVTTEPSQFWVASADGSTAVFRVDNGPLTDDLYEFDVDSETATLIAHDSTGVVGASDDLSHLYFVSKEVLDSGASAGQPNLYLKQEDEIIFVATLGVGALLSPVEPFPGKRTTRVTPDGREVVFTSTRSLTGYDNTDTESGEPVTEVYHFDADSGDLTCVSCNPSGARPVGSRKLNGANESSFIRVGAWIPTWQKQLYARRALSEGGDRVFFNSNDALLPQDTNGVTDVYQWEQDGSGTCSEETGCLSLISTGKSPGGAQFVDATPNGDDVFMLTASGLDPRDPGLVDIYDARVGGGFPPPPPPPPACEGDACQAVPEPPLDPTLSSAVFRGAGNPAVKTRARRTCRARAHRGRKKSERQKQAKLRRCKRGNRRLGR